MGSTPRSSRVQALDHLRKHERSGLSMVQYCRDNSIAPSTFYGWNSRHKDLRTGKKSAPASFEFVELPRSVAAGSKDFSSVRIVRTEIEIPAGSVQHLSEMLCGLLHKNGANT